MRSGEKQRVGAHGCAPVRRAVLRAVFVLLAAGTAAFIFSNSLQSGAASGLRSAAVTGWLNGALARFFGPGRRFSELFVRKLGHFCEFALLGFWLTLSLRTFTRRVLAHASWPLVLGLLAGVFDEWLQLFAEGRGSSVRDVLIDFSGVAFGLLAALCMLAAARVIRGRRKNRAGTRERPAQTFPPPAI